MSVASMYRTLKERLAHVVPDVELRYKAELAEEIVGLKKRKRAVILAHNYMEPALYYSVPDFRGDSLGLSREAARTDADVIVFCGVRFMAETAKILNPTKKVLCPSERAGCSLAEGITAEDVRKLKRRFPGAPVVTYVNSYAEVKAESDVCCTSGNAVKVVRALKTEPIIFLPDEFLAANVARETGKRIVFAKRGRYATRRPFEMVGWNAHCEVHERFTVQDIEAARRQFPDVVVLTHPECKPEVVAASDFSGSTSVMADFVRRSKARRFLVLTECAMADNIAAEFPDREMVRICSLRCPHMNEITLEDTLEALRQERYVVDVPEPIRGRAERAVRRMIEIG